MSVTDKVDKVDYINTTAQNNSMHKESIYCVRVYHILYMYIHF